MPRSLTVPASYADSMARHTIIVSSCELNGSCRIYLIRRLHATERAYEYTKGVSEVSLNQCVEFKQSAGWML